MTDISKIGTAAPAEGSEGYPAIWTIILPQAPRDEWNHYVRGTNPRFSIGKKLYTSSLSLVRGILRNVANVDRSGNTFDLVASARDTIECYPIPTKGMRRLLFHRGRQHNEAEKGCMS
jgi:hypothetical protein